MSDESRDLVQGTLEMLVLKHWHWNRCMDTALHCVSSRSATAFQSESRVAFAGVESDGAGGVCEIGVARVSNESARKVLRLD